MLLIRVFWPRFLLFEILLINILESGEGGSRRRNDCRESSSSSSSSSGRVSVKKSSGCDLNLERYVRYPPMMFSGTTGLVLWDISSAAEGKEFLLSCPGGKLRLNNQRNTRVSLRCAENTTVLQIVSHDSQRVLEYEADNEAWKSLTCTRKVREETKTDLKPCGSPSYSSVLIHIGWEYGGNFTPQFSVCHDIPLETTLYANHTIRASLNSFGTFQGDNTRPSYFKEGSKFFAKSSASQAYKVKNQKIKFSALFGEENSFFSKKNQLYLARGHLAPDGDFDLLHNSLADATYHYINVVPQWQSFNNGNWKRVESSVRLYASLISEDLNIYTGTFRVLHLPTVNGTLIPIYLGEENLIPVPEYLWKLVYNPLRDEAIVFIGLNNPFAEDPTPLCADICRDAHWDEFLGEKRSEFKSGLIYCCSYHGFKDVVNWIPHLDNPYIMQNRL